MTNLTTFQHAILAAAARRKSGALHPLPKTIELPDDGLRATLDALETKGLIAKKPGATSKAGKGSTDDPKSFVITKQGRAAEAIRSTGDGHDAKTDRGKRKRSVPDKKRRNATKPTGRRPMVDEPIGCALPPAEPKAGTKLAKIAELLRRPHGATVTELVKATRWQKHTVRAALTGLRKRGFVIDRDKNESGESTYHLTRLPSRGSVRKDVRK